MRITQVLTLLLVCCGLTAMAQPLAPCPAGSVALHSGSVRVCAEIAQTEAQREYGLMHRATLATDAGMLFLFAHPEIQRFWMKDTDLALSIAFLDDSGKVVNIEDMQPQTLTPHASKGPVRYALEMRLGWFADHHFKAGTRFQGLPPANRAQ